MDAPWIVIIASANPKQISEFKNSLRQMGLDPVCASTVSSCRDILAKQDNALVFCDSTLLDGHYHDLIATARLSNSPARFVVMLPELDWDQFMEANRAGAFHVMSAPYHRKEIEWVIIQAKRNDRMTTRFLKSDSINRVRSATEGT